MTGETPGGRAGARGKPEPHPDHRKFSQDSLLQRALSPDTEAGTPPGPELAHGPGGLKMLFHWAWLAPAF